jgi:hypothetical protein
MVMAAGFNVLAYIDRQKVLCNRQKISGSSDIKSTSP